LVHGQGNFEEQNVKTFTQPILSGIIAVAALVSTLTPDKVNADTIAGAEATRRGVSIEVAQLESANARIESLEKQLAQAKAEINKLMTEKEAAQKKADAAPAELGKVKSATKSDQHASPQPGNSKAAATQSAKCTVLSAQEFAALPTHTKTKTPCMFRDVAMNAVGYGGGIVVSIIDESTAIIEVILEDKDGYVMFLESGDDVVTRKMVVEGISTKDVAENTQLKLGWCKVVRTEKIGNTTYFVAQPIVQSVEKTTTLPAPVK
jgi:hypothetical protein